MVIVGIALTKDGFFQEQEYSSSSVEPQVSTIVNGSSIKISLELKDFNSGEMVVIFTHPDDHHLKLTLGKRFNGYELIIINSQLGPVGYNGYINSENGNKTEAIIYIGQNLSGGFVRNGPLEARAITLNNRGFIFYGYLNNNLLEGLIVYWN